MAVGTTDEDGGFYGYVSTTTDPGTGLLVATMAVCILLNALLPCFVAYGRHREKRREKRVEDNPWAVRQSDEEAVKGFMVGGVHKPPQSIRSMSDVSHSLKIPGVPSQYRTAPAPSVVSFGQVSVASHGTMATSVVNQSVVHGLNGRKSRTQRRFRRALEKRVNLYESGRKADSFFRFDQVAGPTYFPTHKQQVDDDNQSFLSKMDTDEVSVKSMTLDAEHEDFVPKQFLVAEDDEVEISCCGTDAWWKPNWVITYFDRTVALSEWDFEMRRLMKLILPFATQALFTGLLDVCTVATIGKLIGTREVAAYVVVDMLVSLSNEFVGGFWNALTTLCSQAAGAKQHKLCGQYVQMALLLYIFFSIPFMCLWWAQTENVLLWFGFDEETAEIGRDFARVCIFSMLVEGISETFHGLLDVIGLENYSTVIGIAEDVLDFVIVLQVAIFTTPELYHIGMVHLFMGLLFLVVNLGVIYWKGWFKPYMSGLTGSNSLANFKAVWLMFKTAVALSVGFLLTDGEWEMLTLFASFLGPAEVAAWSMIGSLWVSSTSGGVQADRS